MFCYLVGQEPPLSCFCQIAWAVLTHLSLTILAWGEFWSTAPSFPESINHLSGVPASLGTAPPPTHLCFSMLPAGTVCVERPPCGILAVTTQALPPRWWWRRNSGASRGWVGTSWGERLSCRRSGSGRRSECQVPAGITAPWPWLQGQTHSQRLRVMWAQGPGSSQSDEWSPPSAPFATWCHPPA